MIITDIEYTMPMRKDGGKRRSDVADTDCDTLDASCPTDPAVMTDEMPQDEDDDDSEEQWLQSLGIEDSEIRRINTLQVVIFVIITTIIKLAMIRKLSEFSSVISYILLHFIRRDWSWKKKVKSIR